MGFNKGLIIGSLVLSLMGIALMGVFLSLGYNYNIQIEPEYQDMFNEYEATKELADQQALIIEGGEINPEGSDQAVYKNVIIAGKQAQQSGNILIRFLNQATSIIGVEEAIIFIIITLILILVAFGFIYAVSGRNP